ncbi:protein FAM174C [Hoplias malabaricus]|uniref:protein FAM174C n=1 Tax=Hoplias malabaricus TaxID=27720 RepID=UPI0034621D09
MKKKMMMMRVSLFVSLLLALCLADDAVTPAAVATTTTKKADHGAATSASTNKSSPADAKTRGNLASPSLGLDSSVIQRALYVLIGITLIGVLYFLVRAVRLNKTTTQRKKYGLLSNYDDTMEMAHLESDEEDTTVYEAKSLRR